MDLFRRIGIGIVSIIPAFVLGGLIWDWFGSWLAVLGIVGLIAWRLAVDGCEAYSISERSSTLGLPVFIFAFGLAIGFALLAFVILVKFLTSIGARKCHQ